MNFGDPMVIAGLSALSLTIIGAFFAGLVSVITAWRTVAGKISAIEGHVNSEKTASEGRELAKDKEIALLREQLAKGDQRAALLAQAGMMPAPQVVTAPALVVTSITAEKEK
jgi:hypothetical protein